MKYDGKDEWLEERLERYDGWIKEGKIPTSSKVIPIREALSAQQWVLPTQQVLEIIRNARSFALAPCGCRPRYKRCDNPVEVCLYLNDVADTMVKDGKARRVSLDEANERLKLANEHGLVHLTFYKPDQFIYALCSCCESTPRSHSTCRLCSGSGWRRVYPVRRLCQTLYVRSTGKRRKSSGLSPKQMLRLRIVYFNMSGQCDKNEVAGN